AAAIAGLLTQLGYPTLVDAARARLADLLRRGPPDRVVVAEMDGKVVAVMTLHLTPELHRARPIGRVTALVVDESVRGSGVGAEMMEEAERILREDGAGLLELTSNMRRVDAHRFYERLGYQKTSFRFAKEL
ncbi:MAG TPA: GNAT family N-acetyltransferase, partial [Anaeromyxobacteraceae bacterium]|nr:GNAT family N-acetyltransferase [Anaeromyxobacteraceae bacterium]